MDSITLAIAANIAAAFVIICGIKLFDIGSELAEVVRRYGVFIGVIFAFVTIFNFLIPDALETMGGSIIPSVIIITMLLLAIVGRIIVMLRHKLLKPKKKGASISGSSIALLGVMDIATCVASGVFTGFCFVANSGSGVMALCALILFTIAGKVELIHSYQQAGISRKTNTLLFVVSVVMVPLNSIIAFLVMRSNYLHAGAFIASSVGFFAYLTLLRLITIVKKRCIR